MCPISSGGSTPTPPSTCAEISEAPGITSENVNARGAIDLLQSHRGKPQNQSEFFSSILDHMHEGIYVQNLNYEMIYSNLAVSRYLEGIQRPGTPDLDTRAALSACQLADEAGNLIEETDLPGRRLILGAARTDLQDRPPELLVQYRLPDSAEPRWSSLRAYPLYDLEGKLEYAVTVSIEVTSQRRTQEHFKQLAENISEVFWVTDLHKQKMIYISPAYEKMSGRTCESIYLEPLSFMDVIHPEDRTLVREAFPQQISGTYDVEYRMIRADGTWLWIRDRAFPIRDHQGEVHRIAGIAQDITDFKRTQLEQSLLSQATALFSSERDFEKSFVQAAELMVPAFADWCVIDLKKPGGQLRRVALVGRRELKSDRVVRTLLLQENPERHTPVSAQSIRTGLPELISRISPETLRNIAQDELHYNAMTEFNPHSMLSVPFTCTHGVEGAITLFTSESGRVYDDRDLKSLQEIARRASIAADHACFQAEIEEAVRTRDQFISFVSHEIRTPMTALKMQVQMIQKLASTNCVRSPENDQLLNQLAFKAQQQVDEMAKLVKDMFDISALKSGKLLFQNQRIDLVELVRETIERYRQGDLENASQIECGVISLRFETAVVGFWDKTRLTQVISNLIGNAIKYGKSRPIDITVEQKGSFACMTFRDHGIGISPKDVHKIFECYERGSTGMALAGMGLGLYIVRQIVHALGGQISVESELNVGTTFKVEIPLNLS
ncbi:MAG: PAS domain-containing protein [Methylotenera sp.]|nr:PAS domain-containing protein [Oligoflexia bacterium]